MYLSSSKEKLIKIEIPQNKYNNLTRKERIALCNLKNDKNVVMKIADKFSMVVVWDRDDSTKETEKQLGDKGIYEEVCYDLGPLRSTINKAVENIRKRVDLIADTIK